MASNLDYATDASSEERRSCPQCSTRMSSLCYDKHSVCSCCRLNECTYDNKCAECELWSEEEFAKFVKHRKSLDSKSKNRSKAKGSKARDDQGRSSFLDSSSSISGIGNVSSYLSLFAGTCSDSLTSGSSIRVCQDFSFMLGDSQAFCESLRVL